MSSIYGECSCGYPLYPVWFEEPEEKIYKDGSKLKTGRYRKAVSHLICEYCGKNYCIDCPLGG